MITPDSASKLPVVSAAMVRGIRISLRTWPRSSFSGRSSSLNSWDSDKSTLPLNKETTILNIVNNSSRPNSILCLLSIKE